MNGIEEVGNEILQQDIQAVVRSGVTDGLCDGSTVFVTGAILLGFRGPELCAIFLLFAAPTAVSSYPLAVSMDADPELAGQMVIFTTVCCLPTFFLWVMAMSSFGLF